MFVIEDWGQGERSMRRAGSRIISDQPLIVSVHGLQDVIMSCSELCVCVKIEKMFGKNSQPRAQTPGFFVGILGGDRHEFVCAWRDCGDIFFHDLEGLDAQTLWKSQRYCGRCTVFVSPRQ